MGTRNIKREAENNGFIKEMVKIKFMGKYWNGIREKIIRQSAGDIV